MHAAQARFSELLPPHRQPLQLPRGSAPGGAQHHGPFSHELSGIGDQQQPLAAHASAVMPWKPQSILLAGGTTRKHLVLGPPHADDCSDAERTGWDESCRKVPLKPSHPPPTTVVPCGHLATSHVSLLVALTCSTSPCAAAAHSA